tara:strand:- start:110 stop:580 length:471 start_codon:yes stop_codon:yes gene_type:complete
MKPQKIKGTKYKDNRGFLIEVVPKKIKKKFIYSIITESKKNVLRGMHFNKKKNEEKLVYILDGKVLDITINLNKGKSFGKIFYNRLKKNDILLIPRGFAHGYLCLESKNTILYLLNKKYAPKNNSGFFWKNKKFNIKWGIKKPILSTKDKKLGDYI